MATRLDSPFVMLTFSLRHSDVGMTSYRLCFPFVLAGLRYALLYDSSLSRAGSSYAQSSFRLLTLTRLDVILVSYLYGLYACLYLYRPYLYIYWVGDGTIPIFNLLCNHPSVVTCEIPRTLARPL